MMLSCKSFCFHRPLLATLNAREDALFATERLCAYSGGTAGPCAACGAVVLFLVEILNCALAWDFPEI
jgi:hypothetical protein